VRRLVAQGPDEVTDSEDRQRHGEHDGSEDQRSLPATLLASGIAIYGVLRTLGTGLRGNLRFLFYNRHIHGGLPLAYGWLYVRSTAPTARASSARAMLYRKSAAICESFARARESWAATTSMLSVTPVLKRSCARASSSFARETWRLATSVWSRAARSSTCPRLVCSMTLFRVSVSPACVSCRAIHAASRSAFRRPPVKTGSLKFTLYSYPGARVVRVPPS